MNNYGLLGYGVDLFIQNCIIFPPLVNSRGLWNVDAPSKEPLILGGSLQVLELQIISVFALTHSIHAFLGIQGTPIFVSQLLAGLILGPAIVGEMEGVKGMFFPDETSLQAFDTLGMFGIVLFMFLVGVKTDLRLVSMAGKMGIGIAILTRLLILAATNLILSSLKNQDVYRSDTEVWEVIWSEHMAFCLSQGPTPLAVIVYLLSELRMLNSKIGRLAVSWALVGHFCDMFVSIASSFYRTPKNAFLVLFFILSMFFILRPLMRRLVHIIHKHESSLAVQETIMPLTLLLAFAIAYCTPFFEMGPTFAAFLFGLIVPQGQPFGSVLEMKVEPFVTGILLPLFTASVTMRFNPWDLVLQSERAHRAVRVGLVCFLIKLLSTFLPSLLFIKIHWKEALVISLILSSKGFTELVYYIRYKDKQVIFGGVYAAGVVGVVMNSSLLPIAIKSLYASICEKEVHVERSIVNMMEQNSRDLKMLVCVHAPNDVAPLLTFLRAFHPTKHTHQLDLYLLHLRQLTGSHSPIFLVHDRKETKSEFIMEFFEDMILPFYQLEQEFHGFGTMNAYTAISPPKDLKEDIFTLAMNKETSLVILPFHRKWYSGSSLIESENSTIRNLNCSVLGSISCSVGILIHHPNARDQKLQQMTLTSFGICMMFIGGKDDREALALSKIIAKHPSVSFDIIRFVANDERVVSMDWDKVLDVEALKEFRMNNMSSDDCDQMDHHNVSYMEQKVNDGPETALLIRKFMNKYDLIVVGRRYGLECTQTSGLSNLVEFPELGIIGDFLATDADCKTSILIVQQ